MPTYVYEWPGVGLWEPSPSIEPPLLGSLNKDPIPLPCGVTVLAPLPCSLPACA